MNFYIEEKVPYLVMGGKVLENNVKKVDEDTFWIKMKEVIGEKFADNEAAIREHLKTPDSYIEFKDFIFRCSN